MYLFRYGVSDQNIDVTEIVYRDFIKNNIIFISKDESFKDYIFLENLDGISKSIFITDENNNVVEYHHKNIYIDTINKNIYTEEVPDYIWDTYSNPVQKLNYIHSKLKLDYGVFTDEFPEQVMSTKYLTGNEKVLEIGGNIGRNSLVISYILNKHNNKNFVSLESNAEIVHQLIHNRDQNNLDFYIENSALSKRNLVQKYWESKPSDEEVDGFVKVNTITYEELLSKYNINFDTIILDCEGAFYYILMDMPEILDNINLIIMENDYMNIEPKQFVDNVLKEKGFHLDHKEGGGWGPCADFFFEAWKK